MNLYLRTQAKVLAAILAVGPILGCGVFNPARQDGDGYYIAHFSSCGPTAIENGINRYYANQGITFARNPAPREEISKQIQDDGIYLKMFFSYFDREAVQATWSWEMKAAVKKYGFELVSVDDFENLDPKKDIAFILVRGKFISREWHWMCYPVDQNIKNFFGPNTKVDQIYLLKKSVH